MKIGLIARCENSRGLGVLTKNFFDNMPVERVLLVRMRQIIGTEMPDWYPGATQVAYDPVGESLPEDAVKEWIAGLDVVYTAETPYDWRLPTWCKEAGVKLVVHGMPEFVAHGNPERDRGFPHPDQWWWPTSWRLNRIPKGRVMRIPLNRRGATRSDDLRLHLVHVVGHRAVFDRNGTEVVIQAMRGVTADVKLTVHCHDGPLPFDRNRRVEVVQFSDPVEDQWSMYEDQDVLLLPRRYGGLCLDRSSRVTLPDGSLRRIDAVRPGDHVLDEDGPTLVTGRSDRRVDEHVSISVKGREVRSSADHIHLVAASHDGHLDEVKARDVVPGDWMLIARPSFEGLRSVRVGPKPTVKGLRKWWETVDLDEGWARLVGLWLAEGHRGEYARRGRNRPESVIGWSFGWRDRYLADEVQRLLGERGLASTATTVFQTEASFGPSKMRLVRCRSVWLNCLFDELGLEKGSHSKRAPDFHADLVPALVGGWLDGDGNTDGRVITGWSRSVGMIGDLWRLCLKAGVLASITHNGEKLDFTSAPDRVLVASWTTRHQANNTGRMQVASYSRPHPKGWMVRVRAVSHVAEPLDVVAIETVSGRYLAENILTHNCMPALEAAACGLVAAMPECSPNEELAAVRFPCITRRNYPLPGGSTPAYDSNVANIAETIKLLSRQLVWDGLRELRAEQSGLFHDWDTWRPKYIEAFGDLL